jgi:hypothetical protein
MSIHLNHIVNNSDFIDKVAVILFETTKNEGTRFDDSPSGTLSVETNPDQLTGHKEYFKANRNIQIALKKTAEMQLSTISKARDKSDSQHLFKDTGIRSDPKDMSTQLKSLKGTQKLSQTIDLRIKKTPNVIR